MIKYQKPESEKLKAKSYKLFTSGITLVELLIFMAVVVLILSILWKGLTSYRDSQSLGTGTETILAILSEARTKTVSSENDSQYGVYFDSNRAVIFPGIVFAEPNSLNQEFKLDTAIKVSTTSLQSSTSTIVFSRITGEAPNYGTVTLSLKRDSSKSKIISVSRTGEVAVQ